MTIRPLPPEAASRIRASCAITSLNAAVVGLVQNSLDAAATRIRISVDYVRGNCTVDDDGEGIHPAEFRQSGALARPSHTSRWPPTDSCHGVSGEFLAALAQTALLTVASKHFEHRSHNALVFHRSGQVARHTPAPQSLRFLTFEHGTRVLVRDLFGSLPVRVKQRAALFGGPGGTSARGRERDALVRLLVGLMLAWNTPPAGIEIWLRQDDGQKTTRLRDPGGSAPWNVRVGALLAQTKQADHSDGWVKVKGVLGRIAVCGAICLVPAPSKRCQFASFGIHPLTHESGAAELFDVINFVFASSDFGMTDDAATSTVENGTRTRKGLDRWPMFFFRFSASGPSGLGSKVSVFHGGLSELSRMTSLVQMVCVEFLKQHHFGPHAQATSRLKLDAGASGHPGYAPTSTRSATSGPFGTWSIRKPVSSGQSTTSKRKYKREDGEPLTAAKSRRVAAEPAGARALIGQGGQLFRPPFLINGQPAGADDSPARPSSSRACSTRAQLPAVTLSSGTDWLTSLLDRWENPVFEPADPPVPLVGTALGAGSAQTRISRDSLASALVISQVDGKFILVKVSADCLVLVDQHAADERVKLEGLMGDYFASDGADAISEMLEAPLRFELSSTEAERLRRSRSWFAHWGVGYHVDEAASECTVVSLPPAILGRCVQEPRLLVDLIRQALWADHDSRYDHHDHHQSDHDRSHAATTPAAVSSRFHGCPVGILDLLNSRACRTAIMFNDVLSLHECRGLVARLAACALPFQCAHGRPVLAPVAGLAGLGTWRGDKMGS